MRIDCGLVVSVKVARAGLPAGLTQPGKRPSICADVRSASTAKRPSRVGRHGDTAGQPDRNGAADRVADIEAKTVARRLVERARDTDFRVGVAARLAVFETDRGAADLDIALELEALRRGGRSQQRGVDLLSHDHAVGGKIGGVDGDGVTGRSRRQIGLDRHPERDLRAHGPADGRRIEGRVGDVAQAVGAQKFRCGRSRPIELETHARLAADAAPYRAPRTRRKTGQACAPMADRPSPC